MNTPAREAAFGAPPSLPSTTRRGRLVRVLTPDELHKDMIAFGKYLANDKNAALAFLKEAGIVDRQGQLAKAYRS